MLHSWRVLYNMTPHKILTGCTPGYTCANNDCADAVAKTQEILRKIMCM